MRGMLYKYSDDIKIVYNFHSYGPMFVWPYNGAHPDKLQEENPDAQAIFNEIWDGAEFPESTLKGNAIQTVGYQADGEANDYIMKQFNIPSVSPELASDDFFSNWFFIDYDFVVKGVLKDNYNWVYHTFKKLGGELQVDPLNDASYVGHEDGSYTFTLDVKNIGLQDWEEDFNGPIFLYQ